MKSDDIGVKPEAACVVSSLGNFWVSENTVVWNPYGKREELVAIEPIDWEVGTNSLLEKLVYSGTFSSVGLIVLKLYTVF